MKKLLETYLTRITMYTLTVVSLCVLVGVASILPLFDAVSFTPFELIASTAAFIATSIAASAGLAKMYGIRSHLQSALITGLILALLFTPSLSATTLLQYALIAVIAQASKFVLAYKGRHIANPAAIGAWIASIAGIGFAGWWIGSPVLAPFVAVVAFLLLYKTRELPLGILFLATSSVILWLRDIPPTTTLLSWPLLFFAGVMLTEPLTLPPKRWQKYLLALLVAVAASIPYHFGVISTSPLTALLIGNVFAFIIAFRQRAGLYVQLIAVHNLSPTTVEYVFRAPHIYQFDPGQYVELTLPHANADNRGIRRSFSITNAPGTSELRLGIKFYEPSSTFKKALRQLPIGSRLQTTGIQGDFVLPKTGRKKFLFIAGGIGATPFVSHVATYGRTHDIILLYFASTPEELVYAQQLRADGAIVHCFTTIASPGSDQAATVNEAVIAKYVPDASERSAYISGPPGMVTATKSLLRGKVAHIHTDYFSGY